MDRAIGRLINELEQLGIRDNTLIVFASDNGAAVQAPLAELKCNGSLRGRKGQLYEGGIRVPFIVNQPGKVKVQELDNLIYFPDVMPTLANLARATDKLPQRINGIYFLYSMGIRLKRIIGCCIGSLPESNGRQEEAIGRSFPSKKTLLWNSTI
jgi:arylsulfatase A-like enzyme